MNMPEANDGQVTYEIYPQKFKFSQEPVLKAINLDGVTDPGIASTMVMEAFLQHGFQESDVVIEIRDVVNMFFGPILRILVIPWQQNIRD